MKWEHFEAWRAGTAMAVQGKSVCTAEFELGTITTGRQRVFSGYYVEVVIPGGVTVLGRDKYGLSAALQAAAHLLGNHDISLKVAGLDPGWYESGLSYNSTKGYIEGHGGGALFMMDPPPSQAELEADECVDRLIKETVAAMFSTKIVR